MKAKTILLAFLLTAGLVLSGCYTQFQLTQRQSDTRAYPDVVAIEEDTSSNQASLDSSETVSEIHHHYYYCDPYWDWDAWCTWRYWYPRYGFFFGFSIWDYDPFYYWWFPYHAFYRPYFGYLPYYLWWPPYSVVIIPRDGVRFGRRPFVRRSPYQPSGNRGIVRGDRGKQFEDERLIQRGRKVIRLNNSPKSTPARGAGERKAIRRASPSREKPAIKRGKKFREPRKARRNEFQRRSRHSKHHYAPSHWKSRHRTSKIYSGRSHHSWHRTSFNTGRSWTSPQTRSRVHWRSSVRSLNR